MKHSIALLLFVFTSLMTVAQDQLRIRSAEVGFVFLNNNVKGTLEGFTSKSVIDFDQIENSTFKGAVDVKTISTGNSIRNWSLRRGKYFDVDTYPKITFESTQVERDGESLVVKGKLTIKETTKMVTFRFERNGKQLRGTTTLYSSDYGITIKKDREKNKVEVSLAFQLH